MNPSSASPSSSSSSSSSSDVGPGGYKSEIYRGWRYPPFCKAASLDALQHGGQLRPSDIVIATYPKCGTTWMQQIVLTLLAGGDGSKVRDPMKMSPWPEQQLSSGKLGSIDEWNSWTPPEESQECNPGRRVIKTHAPFQLAPWKDIVDDLDLTIESANSTFPNKFPKNGARIIVVTRNPKDTAVSLYNHTMDIKRCFDFSGDWPTFLSKLYLPGLVESSCYWNWTKSWWAAYNSPNNKEKDCIMWISYEEMKRDLAGAIVKIAAFLGIEVTAAQLQLTMEACSFETMKRVAAEEDAKKLDRGEPTKPNHIRQGLVGGWRTCFSPEQIEIFDVHHDEKCRELSLPQEIFYE